MPKDAFSHVTTWVFDLDNTLYPPEIALFDQINQSSKGAFGLNVLQGKHNRTTVRSRRMPEGGLVFQAALRNEPATELADRFGLYTGNLFSPNLYQLFNDFVYKDPSANHDMPMEKLYAVGDEVFPKARKMVLNWVVEKHFIEQFPETQLTRGFLSRGIAGSEFEEKYAREFMSFYLYFMQDELDYLPIYLLAQKSPLLASAELEKVRQKIAVSYDYLKSYYSDDHGRVKPDHREKIDALHKIRNRIHNQLTPDVVPMLDDYLNGTGAIISTESDVGGYPTIAPGIPYPDSDSDGMPDAWEKQHGLNPENAADNIADPDGDGYTNIEEFLNGTGPGQPD